MRWLRRIFARLGGTEHNAVYVRLIRKLARSEHSLRAALGAARGVGIPNPIFEDSRVANPVLDALADQVQANVSAEQSAIIVLNGLQARIQAAVDAALEGGATAAQLAPVSAINADLKASADALAAAIAANTISPVPPVPPAPPA